MILPCFHRLHTFLVRSSNRPRALHLYSGGLCWLDPLLAPGAGVMSYTDADALVEKDFAKVAASLGKRTDRQGPGLCGGGASL